jgi:hypothetical protein
VRIASVPLLSASVECCFVVPPAVEADEYRRACASSSLSGPTKSTRPRQTHTEALLGGRQRNHSTASSWCRGPKALARCRKWQRREVVPRRRAMKMIKGPSNNQPDLLGKGKDQRHDWTSPKGLHSTNRPRQYRTTREHFLSRVTAPDPVWAARSPRANWRNMRARHWGEGY